MEPNHSGDSMYGNNGWPPNQPMPLIPPFLYYPFVLFVPQPNMMQPSSNIGPLRQQHHPPMSGPIRNRRQNRSHPEVPHHYPILPQLSGAQMGANNRGAGGVWSPPSGNLTQPMDTSPYHRDHAGPSNTRDSINPSVYGVPLQSMSISQSRLYQHIIILLQEAYHPTIGIDQAPPRKGGFKTVI